nr:MAG TPA: hypothetical protein [Bacteriophage sp.]
MKTVFKVGMNVYDQLNFPDKEGKVVDICKDECVTLPITVIFKDKYDEEIERYYTSDGRYNIDKLPVLSTKPYQIILQGFEQKAPVPTYEEALVKAKTNFNGYPSYELAMAAESLQKLLFLRDYYNDGWQPDWKNDYGYKYVILIENDKVERERNYSYRRVLAFKTSEIRDKFFEEQKELLEIAKPLL